MKKFNHGQAGKPTAHRTGNSESKAKKNKPSFNKKNTDNLQETRGNKFQPSAYKKSPFKKVFLSKEKNLTNEGFRKNHNERQQSNHNSRFKKDFTSNDRTHKNLFNKNYVSKLDEERSSYTTKNFRTRRVKSNKNTEKNTGDIRLNRYLALAGICSRREADELIKAGLVSVNQQIITSMGYQVKPGDVVRYNGSIVKPQKMVYVLLNKPKDYITTTDDPEGRKTVMDLVAGACPERLFPVGRLDRNTTGLLLLTNDGALAEKLMHPSKKIKKIYEVGLDKPLTKAHFNEIQAGLMLEDGMATVDDIAILSPDKKTIGIEIHIGRNRIVRRIFEHLGYEVTKLDRVMFGPLTKKNLPRGHWRFLEEQEVILLKHLM